MTVAPIATTTSGAAPDRWRTRMLGTSAILLCVIGALVIHDLVPDLVEHFRSEQRWQRQALLMLVTPILITAAHVLLGAGAVAAWLTRRNLPRSRHILLVSFGLTIPLQVLPQLVPTSWYVPVQDEAEVITAILLSIGAFLDLLPVLLSITVGLARAGTRRMRLHPEDPTGATFAFVAQLQMALVLGLTLGVLQPMAVPAWLLLGLLLLMLHYGAAAVLCLRMIRRRTDLRATRRGMLASTVILLLPGMAVLAYGLLCLEFGDVHLIAWGDRPGLYPPAHLGIKLVLFVAHALISATAANDLIASPAQTPH